MFKKPNNRYEILVYISKILFSNKKFLPKVNKTNIEFWENFVKVSSSQLILPSVYFFLKQKNFTNLLPKDLVIYLSKISSLNRNRNELILKQIFSISNLLNQNKINHVFLKGSAILVYDIFKDNSVRMVGDIDILICKTQIFKAKSIMTLNGYSTENSKPPGLTDNINKIEKKHIERLINPKYIAAVELHQNLLESEYKTKLPAEAYLNSKLKHKSKVYLPNKYDLWKHIILNWQYNDYGMLYNKISFRSILDISYLEKDNYLKPFKKQKKAIRRFYYLMSVFLPRIYVHYSYYKSIFKLQSSYPRFGKIYHSLCKLSFLINLILKRLILFFSDPKYRKVILKNPKIIILKIRNFLNSN